MNAPAVVVGASVAGVQAATQLCQEGHGGRIVLIGDESGPPYNKPPMSKQYLIGDWTADRVALLGPGQAEELGIEVWPGTPAAGLDTAAAEVILADGRRVGYSSLVIATGARARPSPWGSPSGVHLLRTRADADGLRADLAIGGDVVVVGGGFIGSEVTAAARRFGCRVTVLDPSPAPMERVLGPVLGGLVSGVHARFGARTRFGVGIAGLTGQRGSFQVHTTAGEVIPAATVVVGIGTRPNVGWLAGSGLDTEDGVRCDEFCRAAGAANVWVAGDAARWLHAGRGEHTRVEHWTNAIDQAAYVARAIAAGLPAEPYRPVEYVWSDQYDWKIQIAGVPHRGATHHLIGDPTAARPRLAALSGDDQGRCIGASTVNWPRASVECRRLLAGQPLLAAVAERIEVLPGGPVMTPVKRLANLAGE